MSFDASKKSERGVSMSIMPWHFQNVESLNLLGHVLVLSQSYFSLIWVLSQSFFSLIWVLSQSYFSFISVLSRSHLVSSRLVSSWSCLILSRLVLVSYRLGLVSVLAEMQDFDYWDVQANMKVKNLMMQIYRKRFYIENR
jgi:hypothetical protein